MCIVVFRWSPDGESPLHLIANRDEFFARPTAPMQWWDGGEVLAGRDLKGGGTWLGITKTGRFAALTNIRSSALRKADAPSRGALVSDFLSSRLGASRYMDTVARGASAYEGFNLLCGEMGARELWFLNSQECTPRALRDGVYGLSNATLDTPWPKVSKLKARFAAVTSATANPQSEPMHTDVHALLRDASTVPDHALPDTGVPLAWERALSAIFIRHQDYGSRASTVLRIQRQSVEVSEQTHSPNALCNHLSTGAATCPAQFKFDFEALPRHL
jgi:uncharacterized protein with NRDE domain